MNKKVQPQKNNSRKLLSPLALGLSLVALFTFILLSLIIFSYPVSPGPADILIDQGSVIAKDSNPSPNISAIKRFHVYELKPDTADTFNRNYIMFPGNITDAGLTARELINDNPGIVMVRYFDVDDDTYYSYLPIRGGIGRNFNILPGTTYEISVKSGVNLSIEIK